MKREILKIETFNSYIYKKENSCDVVNVNAYIYIKESYLNVEFISKYYLCDIDFINELINRFNNDLKSFNYFDVLKVKFIKSVCKSNNFNINENENEIEDGIEIFKMLN